MKGDWRSKTKDMLARILWTHHNPDNIFRLQPIFKLWHVSMQVEKKSTATDKETVSSNQSNPADKDLYTTRDGDK